MSNTIRRFVLVEGAGFVLAALVHAGVVARGYEDAGAATAEGVIGDRVVDPALAAAGLSEHGSPLTDREWDVLAASVDGATIRDVAARLYLSEGTVRNYLSAAIQKLGARNRTEATRLALRKGWL
jgi:two-component system response regulator DesR